MDAALKQRLVGAAVLVALAVIFLPMLVDGPEPPPGTASVPLDIPPAPERDFETRDLPLTPSTRAPTAAEPSAEDSSRVVTVETDHAPRVDALPSDAPTPVAVPAPSAPATPVASESAPPKIVASPTATPGARFAVNLGSYGNIANANALMASLKSEGLSVLSDAVLLDGKPGLRIRLGPYAQRGEAEAARLAATRIRADLPASVVAFEASSSEATPAPVRVAVGSGFAVQIGALKSEADANALRARARGVGLTAYVERVDAESGPLWRVRVGPELQRANAEKLKTTVMQKLQIDGMVVTHP